MNKTTAALNTIFADDKVAAKFAEVTNRKKIEQHIRAEYGQKLNKLTVVSDEDYARLLQAVKEHFYRTATAYCGTHPDTNMITAMLYVMSQDDVNKVAERFVLGAAPVKGVKALFKGAKNLATKAYESAFPERSFDSDMKEFAEDLKESGREVKEELKEDFHKAKEGLGNIVNDAREAVQELKKNQPGEVDAEEAETEEPAEEVKGEPAEESDSEGKKEETPAEEKEEEADSPVRCVRIVVMGAGDPTDIPEEIMQGLPEEVQDILKEIMKNGGKVATEPKEEKPEE